MKTHLLLYTTLALALSSCKEQPKTQDIIVPRPVEEVKQGTQAMSETSNERKVQWLGNEYTIKIQRKVNKDLPKVHDENNLEYYDNEISVVILRADGSEMFNKVFRKDYFASYVNNNDYGRNGGLLGIVFDTIEDNRLVFATSVGSPDERSDEYVPLVLTIDRYGAISVRLDTRMDADIPDDTDGV